MSRIKLTDEEKKRATNEIKEYFAVEREEELGDLAA